MPGVTAVIPKYQFSNALGIPLIGGTLTTYVAGSTTPTTTYQDQALTTANTNPIVLDSTGSCVLWLDSAVQYKFVLKNALGVTQWTQDNISGVATAISLVPTLAPYVKFTDLAAATDAGLIGGTWFGGVVATLSTFATTAGASLMGFIQSAIGAVGRSVQDELRDSLKVTQFGVTTASPDITAALNAAIKHCTTVSDTGGEIEFPYRGVFNVLGKVLLPSHIKLNLKKCTLIGAGQTMFETAYVDGSGNIVSNIGSPPETRLVTNTEIVGGKIRSVSLAFNLYNFIEGCSIIGTRFEACSKSIYADRCFYASFKQLMSRKWLAGAVTDAYTFVNFVNVIGIESCAAQGYDRSFVLGGGSDGQKLLNCSGEGNRVSIAVVSETGALEIDTFYSEGATECGLDLNTAGSKKITVRNSFFNNMPIGIRGGAGMTCDIDRSNRFINTPIKYQITNTNTDFTVFREAPTAISSGQMPVSTGVALTNHASFEQPVIYFDQASGNMVAKSTSRNDGYVPFEFGGVAGYVNGNVPFSTATKKDNNTISVLTSIVNSDMQCVVFKLSIVDNLNSYFVYGFLFGTTVKQLDASGKTVTATTSGGKLVLEIAGLSIPAASFGCSGLVRHV